VRCKRRFNNKLAERRRLRNLCLLKKDIRERLFLQVRAFCARVDSLLFLVFVGTVATGEVMLERDVTQEVGARLHDRVDVRYTQHQ
jgi:hypothetical protein